MYIGRRSAGVNDHQFPESLLTIGAFGEEFGGFQHRRGRRHYDLSYNRPGAGDSFSLNDIFDEYFPYLFIARRRVQHAYLRHDVLRIDNVFVAVFKSVFYSIVSRLIAGNDDIVGFMAGLRQHPGVMDDGLLVPPPRTPANTQDIGSDFLYL